MKNIFALLIILMSVSCVSTKYNMEKNQGNFDQVQAGAKYAVYDFNDNKSVIDITSVENDQIIGTHNKQTISIAKKDIKEIKKIKTTGSIVLVTAGVALVASAIALINFSR